MRPINDKGIINLAKRGSKKVFLFNRTSALCRGLDLVLVHHQVDYPIRVMIFNEIHDYLDTAQDEGVWLKRAKYLLAYPLAKYLRNELPPAPDVIFEPKSRAVRGWMKQYLYCFNRKNTHLWYSWFQVKRASEPVSEEFVRKTYSTHREMLTKKDTGDEKIIEGIMEMPIFEDLLEKVSLQVKHRMKSASFTDRPASGSACWTATRSQGGQYESLRRKIGLSYNRSYPRDGDESDEALTIVSDELVAMRFTPQLHVKGRDTTLKNQTFEVRRSVGFDDWQELRRLHQNCLSEALMSDDPSLRCLIQGILEPMKVRVISKGEDLPYYSMKPLQVAIHSSLRDMAPFRLLGRPLSPCDFLDLKKKAKTTDQWFSVDYSAATDGLSWKYSSQIFLKVIEKLDIFEQEEARRVLGPHHLYYPQEGTYGTCFAEREYGGLQRNGQLMGSILSFPILCLANLGVYLYTTRLAQEGWTDEERLGHVLVNGDDMVYACDPEFWDLHKYISSKVGLEMSVGKAYIHREYANVNSTSIHCNLQNATSTPWQIDFLNAGLFYGQRKVQERKGMREKDGETYKGTIWSKSTVEERKLTRLIELSKLDPEYEDQNLVSTLKWTLAGSLPGRQKQLLQEYLRFHREAIMHEQTAFAHKDGRTTLWSRNLFLPIAIGGLGIPKPVGFVNRVTKIQRNVAKNLSKDYGALLRSSTLPLPGYEPVKVEKNLDVPWSRWVSIPEIYSKICTVAGKLKNWAISCFENLKYSLNKLAYFLS